MSAEAGSTGFTLRLSNAPAAGWGQAMADCLRQLPPGDARRGAMAERCRHGFKCGLMFVVEWRDGAAVMAPTPYARGLLIEARSWV